MRGTHLSTTGNKIPLEVKGCNTRRQRVAVSAVISCLQNASA